MDVRVALSKFIRSCTIGYIAVFILYFLIRAVLNLTTVKTTAIITNAVIVSSGGSSRWSSGMPRSFAEIPTVSYHVSNYDSLVTNDDPGFSAKESYNIGDSIQVFYYPWNKRTAEVMNFANYWLSLPIFLMLFIPCAIITGVNTVIFMRRTGQD